MMMVLVLVAALVALDVLAAFYGADSRPTIGDSHRQPTWPAARFSDPG